LYLGCEVEYPDTDGKRVRARFTGFSRADGIETTYKRKRNGVIGDLLSWKSNGYHDSNALHLKPILRPLNDMTLDELKDFLSIVNTPEEIKQIPDEEFSDALKEIHEDGLEAFNIDSDNVPAIKVSEAFRYLLSKHFDLFGLIEEGLAIYKAELPIQNK